MPEPRAGHKPALSAHPPGLGRMAGAPSKDGCDMGVHKRHELRPEGRCPCGRRTSAYLRPIQTAGERRYEAHYDGGALQMAAFRNALHPYMHELLEWSTDRKGSLNDLLLVSDRRSLEQLPVG
jgi:hypothetical protein